MGFLWVGSHGYPRDPMGIPGIPWGSQGCDPHESVCFLRIYIQGISWETPMGDKKSLSLSLSGLSGKEEIILWALWERGKGGNNKRSSSTYR